MQHNYLSNFLLYYTTLDKHEWFRAASYLETMPIIKLPNKKLRYRRYQCRKQIKTVFNFKQKTARQDFDIVVLEDEEFAFMSNRQKNGQVGNPEGSITIAQRSFVQKLIGPDFLGEKTLVEEKQVILYAVHWQNYLIFSSQVSNVTQRLYCYSSPRITLYLTGETDPFSLKKRVDQLLQRYLPELKSVIQKYPETVKQVDKERDEVDYTLILYYALSAVLRVEQ